MSPWTEYEPNMINYTAPSNGFWKTEYIVEGWNMRGSFHNAQMFAAALRDETASPNDRSRRRENADTVPLRST